jgi:hypothetical protein
MCYYYKMANKFITLLKSLIKLNFIQQISNKRFNTMSIFYKLLTLCELFIFSNMRSAYYINNTGGSVLQRNVSILVKNGFY